MTSLPSILDDNEILDELGLSSRALSRLNIEHFTEKEGTGRDQIVLQYFGEDGLRNLIDIIRHSFEPINPRSLLDLGSGSGTFLYPVVNQLQIPLVAAFDATPKMLDLTAAKFVGYQGSLLCILGDMEQIDRSLALNRQRSPSLPTSFDVILSTLALHHIPNTAKVIHGIASNLDFDGKAVIIDAVLSESSSMEPSDEHPHDGFDIEKIQKLASTYFNSVSLRLLDIKCQETSTREGTDLFLLELSDPKDHAVQPTRRKIE